MGTSAKIQQSLEGNTVHSLVTWAQLVTGWRLSVFAHSRPLYSQFSILIVSDKWEENFSASVDTKEHSAALVKSRLLAICDQGNQAENQSDRKMDKARKGSIHNPGCA